MKYSDALSEIGELLNTKVLSSSQLGGGCIASACVIETASGQRYFLKTYSESNSILLQEANGLKELTKAECIRCPEIIFANSDFLVLEYIEQGNKTPEFYEGFGRTLAQLHLYQSETFGFYEDNFIGASPQYNIAVGMEQNNWPTFYFNKRLIPQLRIAEKNGSATAELSHGIKVIEEKLEDILAGSEEPPSLLHGDLWSGNYLCDTAGRAVLIDPAVYYGHREADLAMTKMFGGFSHEFYEAYLAVFPLKDGWQYREKLYLLYHYLNHFNLFGRGYYQTTMELIHFYQN